MHNKEHIKWLEENNLIEIAKNNSHYFRHVLKNCLGAKKEKILIIGDQGFNNRNISAIMSASYYIAAKNMGLDSKLIIQQVKNAGDRADDAVISSLQELKEGSLVAISVSNKLGSIKDLNLSYREFMKDQQHRFTSTLSMGSLTTNNYNHVINAIDVDYNKMKETSKAIKDILDNGKEVHISTELGTDLYIDIQGKKAIENAADYTKPGSGGNIPAGETYIPPRGKYNVNGKVIIDASIRHKDGTSIVKNPVTIFIENGEIIGFEGKEEARILEQTIEWAKDRAKRPNDVALIGELGIGINKSASLVGATIIDEKIYGTAHVAIGSNTWFGGDIKTIIHLDQVFKNPNIFIDDEKLKY